MTRNLPALAMGIALVVAMMAPVAPAAARQGATPKHAVPFEHAAEHTIASRSELRLLWLPAATGPSDARPVIVALHGCGGLYTAKGTLDDRHVDYARRWLAQGWHVLLVDSFSGRGRREICHEPAAQRTIRVTTRRDDVNAALGWLAGRSDVDARHVALMGWSHGGSTVLRTIDAPQWPLAPAAAIAMYPGCTDALKKRTYAPAVPLLLLVGADDDWTPPQPCAALAQRLQATPGSAPVQFVSYADSYHGFDRSSPVRWREGIPNGADGSGVHAGGNAAARADARPRIQAFLNQHLTQ